jgi:hypothetical protein
VIIGAAQTDAQGEVEVGGDSDVRVQRKRGAYCLRASRLASRSLKKEKGKGALQLLNCGTPFPFFLVSFPCVLLVLEPTTAQRVPHYFGAGRKPELFTNLRFVAFNRLHA